MFQVPSYLTAFIGSVLFSEATSLFQSVCLKNFNKIIFKKLGYCKIATNKWQKESQGCLFFTSLEVYWSYWQSVLVQESVRSLCFGLLVCFDYYKFFFETLSRRTIENPFKPSDIIQKVMQLSYFFAGLSLQFSNVIYEGCKDIQNLFRNQIF